MKRVLVLIAISGLCACGSVGTEPPPNAPSALDLEYFSGGLVIVPFPPGLRSQAQQEGRD